jgi:protein O-mannosyl-transferase
MSSGISINKKLPGRLMPLLAAVFAFAVFLPALRNGFVSWDDFTGLLQNPDYRGLGLGQLKWMFTTLHMGPYQPLSWMTFGLDYLIWGMNPFGYHLTSLVLHSLNTLLFCLLCRKLLVLALRPSLPEQGTELDLAACFAALLFAVHPLRVESVAWVTERRDVLSGFFYLLTLLCYIAPRAAGGENASFRRRHLLPLTAFFLALLSKSMVISLPAVLLVLDVYPLRRLCGGPGRWFLPEARRVWLEKIPYLVLAAVFGAIARAGQAQVGALANYHQFGPGPRAAQVLYSVIFYMWKTLLPFNLTPIHRLPAWYDLDLRSFFAFAAIAALTAGAIAARRSRPAFAAVWVYYLATLSPVSGLVKFGHQSVADRYSYLPCLGFAALAGAGFFAVRQTSNRAKNASLLAACLLVTGLAGLTWRQEKVWRDSEALWSHARAVAPEPDDLIQNDLGLALVSQGKLDRAVWHYREALRLNPENAYAHNNLGIVLTHQGKTEEAVLQYREALRLTPEDAEGRYNLACALAGLKKTEEAAGEYREALRLDPGFAEAHNDLGELLAAQGRSDEAAEQFLEALKIYPGYTKAHQNLSGIMYLRVLQERAVKHGKERKSK